MKNLNFKNIFSTPIAIISLISSLISLTILFTFLIKSNTSYLVFPKNLLLISGALIGGLIAKRSSTKRKEIGATFFGTIGIGLTFIIFTISNNNFIQTSALFLNVLYCVWIAGVSINWILKQNTTNSKKAIILLFNLIISSFIALSILYSIGINGSLLLSTGFFSIAISLFIGTRIPTQILRYVVVIAARLVFRFRYTDFHNIPKEGGALLVSNHVSFLDFLILSGSIQRNIRFVMHQGVFDKKYLKPFLTKLNMIPISPRGGRNNLENFNKRCQKEINDGHVVLIFAEGTVTRNGQTLPFKKGVEHIAQGINAPIIPINLEGVLGSPLSFTNEDKKAIKPSWSSFRKKVFVTIGNPMATNSSVYAIRQKILILSAKTFAKRVNKKSTVGKWILNLDNNKELILEGDEKWLDASEIRKQSLILAARLKNTLISEKKIAFLHRENINFNLITYALSILGKEVVILDPNKDFHENKKILEQLKITICINGIGKSANPCKRYINAKKLFPKASFAEKLKAKIHSILPSTLTLSLFNNSQTKYSNIFTFAQLKDGVVKGNILTNCNIFAKSQALKQVHLTNSYGTILSLHKTNSALGLYMKTLIPITLLTPISLNNSAVVNTVIGKVNQVEKLLTKESVPFLKNILMDNQEISNSMMQQIVGANIKYYQGFGIESLSPIIAVNTPNYEGKDIVGIPLTQESNNPKTVGRPIPSIAIKIVAESKIELGINEWGTVLIKGASLTKQFLIDQLGNVKNSYDKWVETSFIGMIDEKGYLVIKT